MKAISLKENELKEFFEIEKSAYTLAALIESQNQKKKEYEEELNLKKETILKEIEKMKSEWEEEKKKHELESAEWDERERKKDVKERKKNSIIFLSEKSSLNMTN